MGLRKKPLRVTIWLKATEQFPVVLFIMLQKFEILTLLWNLWKKFKSVIITMKAFGFFLKEPQVFSDKFCVREFKIVLIFLKSFFDTPYYKDYNVQFIITDGLCLAQFQSTVPAAPLHTKDLVKHLWLNLHNQASVYKPFWSNSHLLPQVWCHGALGYEQLSYEWLNRLVSTKTNKHTKTWAALTYSQKMKNYI